MLDAIQRGDAAEQALLGWARGARYAGSKDRAAVRDVVFDVLRARRSCAALGGGQTGRALVLGLLRLGGRDPSEIFTGTGHAPAPLSADEALARAGAATQPDVPEFLENALRDSLGDGFDAYCEALRHRAPVFLRVNALKATPQQALDTLALDSILAEPHPTVPGALRVTEGERRLSSSAAYRDGLVELQDASSQAVIAALPLKAGMSALDYCAGGGGKALAMAAVTRAPVTAHDAFARRMADLPERARRAEARVVIADQPRGAFDLVLCDVPCTGSGTWRRAPDGKWRLTHGDLASLLETQQQILHRAAALTAPEGTLALVTCSVLRAENEDAAQRFVAAHPEWRQTATQRSVPSALGDGFFLAMFRRR